MRETNTEESLESCFFLQTKRAIIDHLSFYVMFSHSRSHIVSYVLYMILCFVQPPTVVLPHGKTHYAQVILLVPGALTSAAEVYPDKDNVVG